MGFLVLGQTRPDIGMPVARVTVPGPRRFWERFAPGCLYDVPVKLGWRDSALSGGELNPVPVVAQGADMNFEESLAVTQKRLAGEAGSLAEVLERLRGQVSPDLIGDCEWESVLERARDLPAAMAAFPFGFELPLHENQPGADLGVSVVGGTESAEFFEERARLDKPDPSAAAIAHLLEQTEPDGSPLCQVVGRKLMLEFDVASRPDGAPADPGIFLRPAERPMVGDGRSLGDVVTVLDALVSAVGWNPDAAERKHAERIYLAQGPDTRVESLGAFPSRERALRLAVTGFRNSQDLAAFLERAGWPGQRQAAAAAVARFEKHGGFFALGAHFDVLSGGLGPTLGLSFVAKERVSKDPRYWLDDPGLWNAFVDGLRSEGLGVPRKLSALSEWTAGPITLFSRSGQFVLLRGIHHFKIVLTGDGIGPAKGYVYMALIAAPTS